MWIYVQEKMVPCAEEWKLFVIIITIIIIGIVYIVHGEISFVVQCSLKSSSPRPEFKFTLLVAV